MRCSICGCENENSAEKCSVCGSILTPESEAKNEKTISTSTSGELVDKSKSTKRFIIGGVILVAVFVSIMACAVLIHEGVSNSENGFFDIFKSDEKLILGTWEMDTSDYGEGLDKLANLNGVIVEITCLSDGTCTVDGTSSPENGVWSIVDGQLKVQGTMGGMFWNYNGFLADYDLDGDTLTLYGDDGDDYVYYRE